MSKEVFLFPVLTSPDTCRSWSVEQKKESFR